MEPKESPPPYSPPAPGSQPAAHIGFEGSVPYPLQQPGPFQGAYPGPPPPLFPDNYATGTTVVTVAPAPPRQVLLLGGCPSCRVGVLVNSFTCLGICMAIFFFPLGFICLFLLTVKRCNNCGITF